jgi:hypothetical protein
LIVRQHCARDTGDLNEFIHVPASIIIVKLVNPNLARCRPWSNILNLINQSALIQLKAQNSIRKIADNNIVAEVMNTRSLDERDCEVCLLVGGFPRSLSKIWCRKQKLDVLREVLEFNIGLPDAI